MMWGYLEGGVTHTLTHTNTITSDRVSYTFCSNDQNEVVKRGKKTVKQTNKLITNLHNIQFVIFILYISEVFKNATTFWAENVYKERSVGPRCMNVVSMRMCTSAVFIYIENETNVESRVKKKTWWNWLHGGCMSEIILFYFPTRLALASSERTGFWVSPGCCWLVPFRVMSFSFPMSYDIPWRIIHE